MVIGVLQFELLIHGAESIKDKRRIVRSLKDRLHREHQVSIAEVGMQDSMHVARMGLAVVTEDGKRAGQLLDGIMLKLRALHDAELGDCARQVLQPTDSDDASSGSDSNTENSVFGKDGPPDLALAEEMLRRVHEPGGKERRV